jgi:predicted GNAT superfamily acetyltransferase
MASDSFPATSGSATSSNDLRREIGDGIVVRRASAPSDYLACQQAQRLAWGIVDESYVVPVATMVAAQLHGGQVLGAFTSSGEAVAMSFAFLARIEHRIGLYSQLTGVIPAYQGRGLGQQIKELQAEIARADGLHVIAWAFDPLQAGNAHFNLARLGATVGRYIEDMYGPRNDALNAGATTDRLIAEWDLDGSPSCQKPDSDSSSGSFDEFARLPHLIQCDLRSDGERIPVGVLPEQSSRRVLLEIPAEIARLRREQPDLARSWRDAVRLAFAGAFAGGYRGVGFVRDNTESERPGRAYYLLERALV